MIKAKIEIVGSRRQTKIPLDFLSKIARYENGIYKIDSWKLVKQYYEIIREFENMKQKVDVLDRFLKRLGVNNEIQVLKVFRHNGNVTPKLLIDKTKKDQTTIFRILHRLMNDRKFVYRISRGLYSLTQKGHDFLDNNGSILELF